MEQLRQNLNCAIAEFNAWLKKGKKEDLSMIFLNFLKKHVKNNSGVKSLGLHNVKVIADDRLISVSLSAGNWPQWKEKELEQVSECLSGMNLSGNVPDKETPQSKATELNSMKDLMEGIIII